MIFQISFCDESLRAKSALMIFLSLMNLYVVNKATWVLEFLSTPPHWTRILIVITHDVKIWPRVLWVIYISIWMVMLSIFGTTFSFGEVNKVLLSEIQSSLSSILILLFDIQIHLLLLFVITYSWLWCMIRFGLFLIFKHSSSKFLFRSLSWFCSGIFCVMIGLVHFFFTISIRVLLFN